MMMMMMMMTADFRPRQHLHIAEANMSFSTPRLVEISLLQIYFISCLFKDPDDPESMSLLWPFIV